MNQNYNKGILAGIISGLFWGTPFVVPMILFDYSSIEITFGRFITFGVVSLLFIRPVIKLFRQFNLAEKVRVLILGTTGFWLYTLILSSGVQASNGVIASLIIGSLPVTITLFSKPKITNGLIIGIILIILGLVALLFPLIGKITSENSHAISLKGILYLLTALIMWTWFAIKNSQFMASHPEIKSLDYSSLIGVLNMLCIIPVYFISHHNLNELMLHHDFMNFIVWSCVIGIGASWIANIFWAYSAKNCPSSIGGALIVSETVFGLIYSFIYAKRLPYFNEFGAIVLLISGVILVIYSQRLRH